MNTTQGLIQCGWTPIKHSVIKKRHIHKFVSQPVFLFVLIQSLCTSGNLYTLGIFMSSTSEIHKKAEIFWAFPVLHLGIYLVSVSVLA